MKKSVLLLFLIFISCARAPLKDRNMALRQVNPLELTDDLNLEGLILGLNKTVEIIESKKVNFLNYTFGTLQISEEDYALALRFLIKAYEKDKDSKTFLKLVQNHFDFYEVYGNGRYGEILLTSYYEPQILGSLKKSEKFSRPLYKVPPDLVEISLKEFKEENFPIKMENPRTIYGRFVPTPENDIRGKVIPFYSREELDRENALKGKKLEICYVDPVDAFFLQIQGSGTIILENGKKIRVGYAGQNGWNYYPIGRELTEIMEIEDIDLEKIENHLTTLSSEERELLLAKNPSYVFFKKLDSKPVTTLGVEVIDGRTLATDLRFFPKGALAFLSFDGPEFESDKKYARLVLDSDTGGAIKGGGRADIFWGSGPEAKRYAGALKSKANLYYLAPNPQFLAQLKLENAL